MTAPDDLARTLAEHREVKPWVCLCGWWSAIQEPDGSDYARHLASVVSRRDADLRTRIEALADEWEAVANTDPVANIGCPGGPGAYAASILYRVKRLRAVLDADTQDTCPTCGQHPGDECDGRAYERSRRPADTDTGRGQ